MGVDERIAPHARINRLTPGNMLSSTDSAVEIGPVRELVRSVR